MTRKRPFGVYAIILLQVLSLLGYTFDTYLVYQGLPSLAWIDTIVLQDVAVVLDIAAIIFGLVAITGLWFLKRWAWFLIMVQLGGVMAVDLWLHMTYGEPNYSRMFLNVISVFYLNQRDVQLAFEYKLATRNQAHE